MNEANERQSEPMWRVVHHYAGRQVARLQGGYLSKVPAIRADIARLRQVDPSRDDRALLVWETVFVDPPERMMGHGDGVTRSERALVAATHFYAVHQQSKSEAMHVPGVGLGTALRRLINPSATDNREKPVMRRYHALTTATELPETLSHLSGLVNQLRAEGIPLDYARLATDLFQLSHESSRTRVRLAWARDLTRTATTPTDDSKN